MPSKAECATVAIMPARRAPSFRLTTQALRLLNRKIRRDTWSRTSVCISTAERPVSAAGPSIRLRTGLGIMREEAQRQAVARHGGPFAGDVPVLLRFDATQKLRPAGQAARETRRNAPCCAAWGSGLIFQGRGGGALSTLDSKAGYLASPPSASVPAPFTGARVGRCGPRGRGSGPNAHFTPVPARVLSA
jgi:hypothetical protein